MSWTLKSDGSHEYTWSGEGDGTSLDAQRELFARLKQDLRPRERSIREQQIAIRIAITNSAMIDALPERGRATLKDMAIKIVRPTTR